MVRARRCALADCWRQIEATYLIFNLFPSCGTFVCVLDAQFALIRGNRDTLKPDYKDTVQLNP
jgi:hypothetical protein